MPGNIFHFFYNQSASKKEDDNTTNTVSTTTTGNIPTTVNSIDTLNRENVDFFDYHYKWSNRYEFEIKKEETLLDKVVNYLNRETFMDIIN